MSKSYFVKITGGKITIPKELRGKLGLFPGTQITLDIKNGSLIMQKKEGQT
jgi:AbrB family looped-hinge helix DNA binding protein